MYALIAGLLFGAGLAVSGMILPEKVIGFLDLAGQWDPSLMLVMSGALGVFIPGYLLLIKKRRTALDGTVLNIKSGSEFDAKLILGAAIFGIGWGLGGICPGPAISMALLGGWPFIAFIVAMLVGMFLAQMLEQISTSKKASLLSSD